MGQPEEPASAAPVLSAVEFGSFLQLSDYTASGICVMALVTIAICIYVADYHLPLPLPASL